VPSGTKVTFNREILDVSIDAQLRDWDVLLGPEVHLLPATTRDRSESNVTESPCVGRALRGKK
jgi:hypothetical protein